MVDSIGILGYMNKKEKILRDGLKDISLRREDLPHGRSIISHEATMALEILAKADEIKDGPSFEDKRHLNYLWLFTKSNKGGIQKWLIVKLMKEWGMALEKKRK